MQTCSACIWLLSCNNTGYCISVHTAVHDQRNSCLALATVPDNYL